MSSRPEGFWVSQQARQFVWEVQEHEDTFRHLVHDRDSKYTKAFDDVFRSEGINIICTPVQAPNANAYAERFVRSLSEECLDNLLIINESQLRNVLNEYVDYYNLRGPHQGLKQKSPVPRQYCQPKGIIVRRKVLGGIVNDYQRIPSTALGLLGKLSIYSAEIAAGI